MGPRLVIENLEAKLSEWLYLEYAAASRYWGGAIFTRVPPAMRPRLCGLGEVHACSFRELFGEEEVVILDPRAEEPLTRDDLLNAEAVVVGGILGYDRPRGRTAKHITRSLRHRARHLGRVQLSIDTAALVSRLIYLGERLENIEVSCEVEVRLSEKERVLLPYGYVVYSGRVLLTPGLVEYLTGDEWLSSRQREAEPGALAGP